MQNPFRASLRPIQDREQLMQIRHGRPTSLHDTTTQAKRTNWFILQHADCTLHQGEERQHSTVHGCDSSAYRRDSSRCVHMMHMKQQISLSRSFHTWPVRGQTTLKNPHPLVEIHRPSKRARARKPARPSASQRAEPTRRAEGTGRRGAF